MTKSKTAKVKAELYPLSKKEFEDLYDKAWENGWVYGKFFQELYDEYLVNWVYFVDYLDVLKGVELDDRMYKRIQDNFVIVTANNQKPILIEAEDHYGSHIELHETLVNIEILIGEAPPYWKGNAENKDKSYFYNPNYFIKKGSWITAPLTFKGIDKFKSEPVDKTSKLSELAKMRMFLFDVFPFPIIQDTKIRQAVSGKFPEHIQTYFIPKLNSIINYIVVEKENITYGFVATTYGSLHLLFGDQTRDLVLNKFDKNFYKRGIDIATHKIQLVRIGEKNNQEIVAFNKKNIPTVLFKTIYKLFCPAAEYSDDRLKKIAEEAEFETDKYVKKIREIFSENMIPILMDGSGNVNFTNFLNSTEQPSLLDEDENFEKNQQEED